MVLVVVRGEEDDRHAGRLAALLDELDEFEAAHVRHVDVEDHEGEFMGHEGQERLVGRFGADQAVAGVVENRFEDGEVLRLVVDDQDVDRRVLETEGATASADPGRDLPAARSGVPDRGSRSERLVMQPQASFDVRRVSTSAQIRPVGLNLCGGGNSPPRRHVVQRNSQTRISDRSCSVFTGLAM